MTRAPVGTFSRLLPASQQRIDLPAALLGEEYRPCNVSLQRSGDGYVALVRLTTHRLDRQGWTYSPPPRYQSLSRLVVVLLDSALRQIEIQEVDVSLLDEVTCQHGSVAPVYGLEDPRLFWWRDALWFTTTSYSLRPWEAPSVALGRLDPSLTRVDYLVPLEYAGARASEKNWLPLPCADRLLLLYSTDPTLLLEADPFTGQCHEAQRSDPPRSLRRLRGSGPPLRIGERHLYTAHEMAIEDGGYRIDRHRFVQLDEQLRVSRVSRLYRFRDHTVEYSCGLCLAHDDATLLLSWSYRDSECWIAALPLSTVVSLLRPVADANHAARRPPRPR